MYKYVRNVRSSMFDLEYEVVGIMLGCVLFAYAYADSALGVAHFNGNQCRALYDIFHINESPLFMCIFMYVPYIYKRT